jgi:hypothetical protein
MPSNNDDNATVEESSKSTITKWTPLFNPETIAGALGAANVYNINTAEYTYTSQYKKDQDRMVPSYL